MKHREPRSFAAAITRVRDKLGERQCAMQVGKSASLVRKWADPDQDSLPNLECALLLDAAYVGEGHGDPPILDTYATLLKRAASEQPSAPALDIVTAALSVQGAVGDLSEAVLAARQPNGPDGIAISANERQILTALLEKLDDQIRMVEGGLKLG